MAKIRAVLGGGVDVPIHLMGGAAVGAAAGAAAATAGGEKHAALAPSVHAGAVGGTHVASAGSTTHIDNRKTHVAINVQGGNDPKATAKAVYDAFKAAARSQLHDGVLS